MEEDMSDSLPLKVADLPPEKSMPNPTEGSNKLNLLPLKSDEMETESASLDATETGNTAAAETVNLTPDPTEEEEPLKIAEKMDAEPTETTTTSADNTQAASIDDHKEVDVSETSPSKSETTKPQYDESNTMMMLQNLNQRTFKPGETFSLVAPDDHDVGASGVELESAFGISMRRKLKFQCHVTSGLTKNEEKKIRVGTFWNQTWPKLEGAGWTRYYGLGSFAGAMRFFKPTGRKDYRATKGEDYFDRIRDVLDYAYTRKEGPEVAIAEQYEISIDGALEALEKSKMPCGKKRRRTTDTVPRDRKKQSMSSDVIDLSWKVGGRNYPKKTSRVGENYQVEKIPEAGTFPQQSDSEGVHVLWDPLKVGEKLSDLEKVMSQVPSNKKARILFLLGERCYETAGIEQIVEGLEFNDGSDWDDQKRLQFRNEIFRLRKDLTALCKIMDISMKTCLAYYFGKFKSSDDYRVVKTVCSESRFAVEDQYEHETDVCAICGEGGNLLICDGCEGEYHMTCQNPALKEVPEGDWECDECVNRKFLGVREYLIRKSDLFQVNTDEGRALNPNMITYRPTDIVLQAVGDMAKIVADAVTTPLPPSATVS